MTRPAFATLVTPERINPYPIQYVYLQIIIDGVEHGYNIGYVVRESFDTPPANRFPIVRALARLLIGNKRSDLTYDRFDSMNSISFPDSCA